MKALRVGLTGGIGAGKSTALREFARLGARTLSLDEVARRQARPGTAVHRALARAFGTADRAALARRVFSDSRARRRLERLTHPPILREMRRWLSSASGVAVVDVPLLFEGGYQREFDVTLCVSASGAARLRRVLARDRASAAQARARMAAQMSDARRRRLADVVILNEGSPAAFRARVRQYHRGLDLLARGARVARRAQN